MSTADLNQPLPNQQTKDVVTQDQHVGNNEDESGRGNDRNGFRHGFHHQQDANDHISYEKKVIQNDMWNVVFLDECQFIKKETTSYNRLAMQLDRDALLLVSANPLATLQDLHSYLRLMWDTAWPFSYSFESDSAIRKTLHDTATYGHLLKREDLYGVTLKRVVTGEETRTNKLTPRQRERCEEYIRFVLGGHGPAYLLHPKLFKDLWVTKGDETSALVPVTLKILEMVSVRRGLLTPMKLPSGDVNYVGERIAGLAIRTIELTPAVSVRRKFDEHISRLEDLLEYPEDANVEEEAMETILNGQVHRRLSMISTDVNNAVLTTPTTRLLKNLSTLEQSVARPIPARRSKDVNQLAFDTTGGLQWLFYNTRDSHKYSFPTDRLGQVRFAAWDSPKYCHVLLTALEAKEREERLLVYVNNPLTSQ
jgi:hypothetical protein